MATNYQVGVIGLGSMGAPMATNLAKAGFLKCIWNRTPLRAQQFVALIPTSIAATPAKLAQDCNVVLVSVTADADLLAVIGKLSAILAPETVVIDISTVAVATAQQAAQILSAKGAHFLDAPVSGGIEGANAASLAMMVGGDARILNKVRPVLNVIAANVTHMGAVGMGQAAKAVNQVMIAGINQAVAEALAFAQALELPLERVIGTLSQGAAANWLLAHRGATMVRGECASGFKINLHYKDLVLCKALAANLKAQLPVVEMSLIHYKRLIEAGYGDCDISALFSAKQDLFLQV